MNFFKKSQHNTPANEPTQEPKAKQQPATEVTPRTAEELARQWWSNQFDCPIPDEVIRWIKELTHAEARRQRTASSLLSPQQIARNQEALRLAETKLDNIEKSLQRLHDQQEWVRRFQELTHDLTEHRNRMYQVNKQLSAIANEERELARYEAFETIQGNYERLRLLERQARENKDAQSLFSREKEEAQRQATEQQKLWAQAQDELMESQKRMSIVLDQTDSVHRMQGANSILEIDLKEMEDQQAQTQQNRTAILQVIGEQEQEAEQLRQNITRLSTQRQSMEPHQQMVEHGELVVGKLDRLYEMEQELTQMASQQTDVMRRQTEENELLGRVFSQYQSVDSDIKSLNDELYLHRQTNLGQRSYSLQERAMKLKSRREKLISGLSLWNRIQSGYILIEAKSRDINRLRLSLDNVKQNLDALETELGPMRRLCHEKEYTLTLSKSQNVIQLRSDLREGTCCTVCGATHHPYHSDTMLEQNKLIGEIRTEYELLHSELVAKEERLLGLRTDYASLLARREVEEQSLSALRQRQLEDVKEWQVYSSLDRSFQECSSSTNLEARTALLRQLIENAEHDADEAQNELDQYNFHQTRINEITEQLTQLEQRKGDLTVRLNEVNTGCQVMAGRVERIQQMHATLQQKYSKLYEELGALVTLSEWYPEWKRSQEGLKMRIEQMMASWKQINTEIQSQEHQLEVLGTSLAANKEKLQMLDLQLLNLREKTEHHRTLLRENMVNSDRMTEGMDVKEYYVQNYQRLMGSMEQEQKQGTVAQEALEHLARIDGQQNELLAQGQRLDERTANERSSLDVWMRKFNANNPPVQYAELERVFGQNKDWSGDREQMRSIRLEAILEQSRVDQLRSALVALQAEGKRPSNAESEDVMESLVAQIEVLENRRQEVMMQIAELRIAQQNHDRCTAQLKEEEEELYRKNL